MKPTETDWTRQPADTPLSRLYSLGGLNHYKASCCSQNEPVHSGIITTTRLINQGKLGCTPGDPTHPNRLSGLTNIPAGTDPHLDFSGETARLANYPTETNDPGNPSAETGIQVEAIDLDGTGDPTRFSFTPPTSGTNPGANTLFDTRHFRIHRVLTETGFSFLMATYPQDAGGNQAETLNFVGNAADTIGQLRRGVVQLSQGNFSPRELIYIVTAKA